MNENRNERPRVMICLCVYTVFDGLCKFDGIGVFEREYVGTRRARSRVWHTRGEENTDKI